MTNSTTPHTKTSCFLTSTTIRLNKEINKSGQAFIYVTNQLGQEMVSETISPTVRNELFQASVWVNRHWNSRTQECTLQVLELVGIHSTKGFYKECLVRYTKVLDSEELSTPITDAEVLEEWELDNQYQAHRDIQDYFYDDLSF